MFDIKNVDIMVSTRYLIKNLNLTLNRGDKCAIIGEEGNGKSTLLKSLLGVCDYATVSGSINFNNCKVGYLKQNLRETGDTFVKSYLFKDEKDYYDKINFFYKLLSELFIDEEILEQRISTLSGGELVKVSLLKLLLEEPDILFLDEPTNDLDIESLEWLEKFINSTDKPVLYVSHDETLLSNTANMILHLEQLKKKMECKHTVIKSRYDEYIDYRLRDLDNQTRIAKNERRELKKREEKLNRVMQSVEYQQNNISRKDPHGAKVLKMKMHSLKAQEAKLEKEILTDVPDPEESIYFKFADVTLPSSKEILNFNIKELSIGEKVLAKNVDILVKGSEHVAIIGKNGVGKTSLMRLIYKELIKRDDIKIGYMPQNYQEIVSLYETPLDFVASTSLEDKTEVRKYLGNMKFTREEMHGKISDLSNGSIAKLFLTKFVHDKCNVLLLDEPTRNVSPLSNPVIREELNNFNGCIISITHDRKFLESGSTSVYELTCTGFKRIK